MSRWSGDEWRWYPSCHQPARFTAVPTIVVSDLTDEEKQAREQAVKDGARVIPFGFGPREDPEPLTWEGDGA